MKFLPVRMPESTSKVKFFETSRGSLQEGEGQRSGYPAPLHAKSRSRFEIHIT